MKTVNQCLWSILKGPIGQPGNSGRRGARGPAVRNSVRVSVCDWNSSYSLLTTRFHI